MIDTKDTDFIKIITGLKRIGKYLSIILYKEHTKDLSFINSFFGSYS